MNEIAHRPWPMPSRPWVMTQTWVDLLFAHWPVPADEVRRLVPRPFELDLYDGRAWVGVVPFVMKNVGLRGVPWASQFPELNVRTYVRASDRAGVLFFSLDAGHALAVLAARRLLNLPYYRAAMRVGSGGHGVSYASRRRGRAPSAEFQARYEAAGAPYTASPGSLDYFLTERYCLGHVDGRGRPYWLDIHHPPWPLQPAAATISRNTMLDVCGVALPSDPPLLHFVKRQDTVAWTPSRFD